MRFEDPHAHASGPTGFPRISSGTARVVDVLDADPGLAEAAGASSSTGRPALPAVVVDVPCGVWKPPLKARPDAVGLLVLGGFLARRTQYGASRSLELIAPGDLLRPWLNDGEGVIVFPEGTSTKGEEVLPFNSSFFEFAAEADIPVSYVALGYRTPQGELPASEAVCWWDDTTFMAHMLRLFSLPSFTAILHFGEQPVLNTDRKKLAHELHDRVAGSFVPVI